MFSDPEENKKKQTNLKSPENSPPPFTNLLKQILRRTPALAKQKTASKISVSPTIR